MRMMMKEKAVDEINIEEYEAGEARDAVIEYPKWMQRIEFGSKVLPIEPCTIGDAQPEFIKIPPVADWITYRQDLQTIPTELLWRHRDGMETFSTEPEIQDGPGLKDTLPGRG